jgi:hypothetical protein
LNPSGVDIIEFFFLRLELEKGSSACLSQNSKEHKEMNLDVDVIPRQYNKLAGFHAGCDYIKDIPIVVYLSIGRKIFLGIKRL